jgi:hypothetical protein
MSDPMKHTKTKGRLLRKNVIKHVAPREKKVGAIEFQVKETSWGSNVKQDYEAKALIKGSKRKVKHIFDAYTPASKPYTVTYFDTAKRKPTTDEGTFSKKESYYEVIFEKGISTEKLRKVPVGKDGTPKTTNFYQSLFKAARLAKKRPLQTLDKRVHPDGIKRMMRVYSKELRKCPCGKGFYVVKQKLDKKSHSHLKFSTIFAGGVEGKENILYDNFFMGFLSYKKNKTNNYDVVLSIIEILLDKGFKVKHLGSIVFNEYNKRRLTLQQNQKLCPDCKDKKRELDEFKRRKKDGRKRCEWCGRIMRGKRCDANTCRAKCRQALYRQKKKML